MNSYVEVFRESNDPEAVESQREYLKANERRFDNLNKYHRLIQVKNGWDGEGWDELATLVTPDVTCDRPGYPTICGVAEFLNFAGWYQVEDSQVSRRRTFSIGRRSRRVTRATR